MRSITICVICLIFAVLGPLQTSVAVSIDEQGGSKSLAGEHNEGNAILQPKMEDSAVRNGESGTAGVAEEDSEMRPIPTDDIYQDLDCLAGTYRSYRRCIPCRPGSYSEIDNATTCTFCSGNTIAASYGSTLCTECPAGYVAVGRTHCDLICSVPTDAPVLPPTVPPPSPVVSPVEHPTRPSRPSRPSGPICRYKNGCSEP